MQKLPMPLMLILAFQGYKILELAIFAKNHFIQGNVTNGYAALITIVLVIMSIYGMYGLRPWGRHLQILLSSIGLFPFSLNTAVNGLILIYLISDEGKKLFYPEAISSTKED
jgi:hypothetical protein